MLEPGNMLHRIFFFRNLTAVRINYFSKQGNDVGVGQQIIMDEKTNCNFKVLKAHNALK